MSIGPCLCGDPECSICGPAQCLRGDQEAPEEDYPQQWPPEQGKCGWGGCDGDLTHRPRKRFGGWSEPDQDEHWECLKCGMVYSCTLSGDPDYFEYY